MRKSTKIVLWGAATLAILAVCASLWIWRFHRRMLPEVSADVKAAIASRHSPHPALSFLDARYGSMSNPTNREKAFIDFFSQRHIQGMHLIVSHMKGSQSQTNIAAMAHWIADYRQSMTPEEKQFLGEYFRSDAGRAQLRQATSQYLDWDVKYRAATAPVITELMSTVGAVQQP